MTTVSKPRKLVISGEAWHADPPARVVIHRSPSKFSLLECIHLLEQFCRQIAFAKNHKRRGAAPSLPHRRRCRGVVVHSYGQFPARD